MSLREAMLGLLDDGPMTGYEIKQSFRNVIQHFWSVSYGQLYPTLKKMHKDGLISLEVVEQKGTANKHVYSITDKGRERFAHWIREPVIKFEELKEPFVLKVFFFSKLSREEILEHLHAQRELHARILEEIRGVRDTYEEDVSPYQRMIGYAGILYVEVRLLWLARMIDLVEQGQIAGMGCQVKRRRTDEALGPLIHRPDRWKCAESFRVPPGAPRTGRAFLPQPRR